METIFFTFFSILAVVTALLVITSRHPTTSVLYLLLTMFAIAGLFVLLEAYFLAAIQVIVYAGAILVLFLFVIMLLGIEPETDRFASTKLFQWLGRITAMTFCIEIGWMLSQGVPSLLPIGTQGIAGTTAAVGELLFTKGLLPFEMTSLLLLSAIIGAVVLARRKSVS